MGSWQKLNKNSVGSNLPHIHKIENKRSRMNSKEKRYPAVKPPPGWTPPPVSMVVLETSPKVKKCNTKRYPDGRTLSLLLVDEVIIKKSVAFSWK
jgi:hypothetical protein